MFWNRSTSAIRRAWQAEAEQSLESDAVQIVELGASNILTDNTPALFALQRWNANRVDVSTPIIPAGGLGPLWTAALLQPGPWYSELHAPEPIVYYAGATEAEYLTSLAILHSAVEPASSGAAKKSGFASSYFSPWSQPGSATSWDSQPFLETYGLRIESSAGGEEDARNADLAAPADEGVQDWLAWIALLLALFLILLAVVL